ncbi:6183_t:CDS:2, partial [Entrophospora sp. SA101]
VTTINITENYDRINDTIFQVFIENDDNWKTKSSYIKLIHWKTNVAIWTHDAKLPEWAFSQQEVNGNKQITKDSNIWIANEIIRANVTRSLETKKPIHSMSFIRKFFELQLLMIERNSRIVSPHPYQSRPIDWLFLTSGISFWTNKEERQQIYLLGNPISWLLSVISIFTLILLISVETIIRRRGVKLFNDWMCPKDRLFKGYIELELQLREFDRCRTLYYKYLEYNPANCYAWIKFAELEKMLGDYDRCRGIFELAVDQPIIDMPELLWKAYIDFEFSEQEFDKTRQLYERLLEKTGHVKVWISFAQFELYAEEGGNKEVSVEKARKVFERAYNSIKERDLKEERVLLLESWKDFESNHGTEDSLSVVEGKMPKVVKKRRKLDDAEGHTGGVSWEEYFDYIFPDDQTQKPNFKLSATAHAWWQKVADG